MKKTISCLVLAASVLSISGAAFAQAPVSGSAERVQRAQPAGQLRKKLDTTESSIERSNSLMPKSTSQGEKQPSSTMIPSQTPKLKRADQLEPSQGQSRQLRQTLQPKQ